MEVERETPQPFSDTIEAFHALLRASALLRRLGQPVCSGEWPAKTPYHPRSCQFTFDPSKDRRVVIDLCYSPNGNHFFVVEVFNVAAPDSFLLDEWLSQLGVESTPYPYTLSSYAGSGDERLAGFAAFIERHLTTEGMLRVLAGRDWEHIPYNWGASK